MVKTAYAFGVQCALIDAGLTDKTAAERTLGEYLTGANAGESKLKATGRSAASMGAGIGGVAAGLGAGYGLGRLAQKIPRLGGKLRVLPAILAGVGGLGAGGLAAGATRRALGGPESVLDLNSWESW